MAVERSSMKKPKIFPKRLKYRVKFQNMQIKQTFHLYDLDTYVNHLKTYHTLFTNVKRQG